MIIDHVWHFAGKDSVPSEFRSVPAELSDADLIMLSRHYDVMIYREKDVAGEITLALDDRGGRFRQR